VHLFRRQTTKSAYVRNTERVADLIDGEFKDGTDDSLIDLLPTEQPIPKSATDSNLLGNQFVSSALYEQSLLSSVQRHSDQLNCVSGGMRQNGRTAFSASPPDSRRPKVSKSVNNLSDHANYDVNGNEASSMSPMNRNASISIAKLEQMTLNPLATILNSNELLQFASTVVPRNKVYQCTIIRDKKGIDRSFYPTYYMHLQGQSLANRKVQLNVN
jgi:hypothetical protein